MLRGTVFGIALTIGGAYMLDSMATPEMGQMVNWDVASARAGQIFTIARDKVGRMIDEAKASFQSPDNQHRATY